MENIVGFGCGFSSDCIYLFRIRSHSNKILSNYKNVVVKAVSAVCELCTHVRAHARTHTPPQTSHQLQKTISSNRNILLWRKHF